MAPSWRRCKKPRTTGAGKMVVVDTPGDEKDIWVHHANMQTTNASMTYSMLFSRLSKHCKIECVVG